MKGRSTLTVSSEKSELARSLQATAVWGPAKFRSLVCEGDPMFLQHADLLPARTTSRNVESSKMQRSFPKVALSFAQLSQLIQ